jgi:hypothetical protein
MPIKQTTPNSNIDRWVEEYQQRIIAAVVRNLCYVGEKVVNHARSLPSLKPVGLKRVAPHQPNYIDWSANLRSSIGYVVAVDGAPVNVSDFATVGSGSQGSSDGRDFATRKAAELKGKISLIVVAGEHYAAYVSAKGYDVLDSAEILAEQLTTKLFKSLGLIK